MNTVKDINPWKGLASYEETEILYGRDEEIESLYYSIKYNDQTVMYGRSGIGKSSIIKAGIFPKARIDGLLPVYIRLVHSTEKDIPIPYIDQIHNAIKKELENFNGDLKEILPKVERPIFDSRENILHYSDNNLSTSQKNISDYDQIADESLWEYLHRHTFWIEIENKKHRVKPMLVFDQFEEIFSLEKDKKRISNFFLELADLLNAIKPEYLVADLFADDSIENNDSLGFDENTNIFSDIIDSSKLSSTDYLEGNDFHIVFALREDYLSYLERNTINIPSLKHNRFCLEAINEEQAAAIIMKPIDGLVKKDVAKLIIEKVTDEVDFKLDGKPELKVDVAILSLYLSRLFEKRDERSKSITKEVVNKFGADIIPNFYDESLKDISPFTVEFLEDHLLNNDGKRENVSAYNAKHIGKITDDEIALLADKRKLLRKFSYDGAIRIEFIHDILCPIIADRRNTRKILKEQLEEEQRLKLKLEKEKEEHYKERKRQRTIIGVVASSFIISVIFMIYGFFKGKEARDSYRDMISMDAGRYFENEEFQSAKEKYEQLNELIGETDTVNARISKCIYFDSVSSLFYSQIEVADSLTLTNKDKNVIEAGRLYKSADSLNYIPGGEKLETKMDVNNARIKIIVNNNIIDAKTHIEGEEYPAARDALNQVLELDPENKEALRLLNSIN